MTILATDLDWPEGTKFFEVQCRLGLLGPDGEDADKAPDVKALGGTVRIAPRTPSGRIRILEPDGKYRVVVTTPLTFAINETTGKLVNTADNTEGVWIVDPASDTIDPKGFTYSAVVTPKVGSRFTVEFDGTVAIDGVYDLANGAPVAPLRGDSLLESRIAKLELEGGPAGPPGPKGDPGADSTVPGPKGDPGADSTVPGPKGEPGEPGADGRGIESITDDDEDGIATVLYTDGVTGALPLPRGPQGDPAPPPEIAWAGDVLTVDGVSSPPLSGPAGPAPATSWSGTSLIVGDNPPVDLRGPVGERGPVGSPGAVATAADFLLVGPGRPDTPASTGGVITGSEPVGAEYRSTDGAGVGAWAWRKRPTGWAVTDGDTGWRYISGLADMPPGGEHLIRRAGNQVTYFFGQPFQPGTGPVALPVGEYQFDSPQGFKLQRHSTQAARTFYPPAQAALFDHQNGAVKGLIRVWHDSSDNFRMARIVVKIISAVSLTGNSISFFTSDPWPTTLPGTPA